jgi:D-lactate dehydrogenase (cytochrome)
MSDQTAPTSAIEQLMAMLPKGSISTDAEALDAHSHDCSHHRWDRALAVVHCERTEEVSSTLRVCSAQGVPVVARGAGTGVEGAANAFSGAVVLDLSRMNQLLAIHDRDFDVVVQPGVMKSDLNEKLASHGLWFPAGPGADASVGGMLSTRASGTHAVGYGTVRESALGLKVVLADGRTIKTGTRARKSAAGYDLTHLFIGAEGTLGIITEATLRVHPQPESTAVLLASFASLEPAAGAVYQVLAAGVPLSRVELMDATSMMAINRYVRTSFREADTLVFEVAGSASGVGEQLAVIEGIVRDGGGMDVRAETASDRIEEIWNARHAALPASAALIDGASTWSTDVCVPISSLAECITATQEDVRAQDLLAPIVGHVGDGNFHLSIVLPPGDEGARERAHALNNRLVRRALELDGTCTGEHGVGRGKRRALRDQYGPGVDVMAAVKQALDPQALLNPGAIFQLD